MSHFITCKIPLYATNHESSAMQLIIYLCRLMEAINGCPRLLVLDISWEQQRLDIAGAVFTSGLYDPHLPRRLEVLRSNAFMLWDSVYIQTWKSKIEEMCPNLKYLELGLHQGSSIQARFYHKSRPVQLRISSDADKTCSGRAS